MSYYAVLLKNELCHHGIIGQKWGVRRFQNKDGSLTGAGRKRYDDGNSDISDSKKIKVKFTFSKNEKNEPEEPKILSDEERTKAVHNLDFKTILNNSNQFTEQELSEVQNRAKKISAIRKEAENYDKYESDKTPIKKAMNMGISSYKVTKNLVNEVLNSVKMYDDVMALANRISGNGGTP